MDTLRWPWLVLALLAPLPVLNGCSGGPRDPAAGLVGGTVDAESAEAKWMLHMREEEKLARDVYALHGADRTFADIAASEQQHFDRMGALLAAYGLADPAAGRPADEASQRNRRRVRSPSRLRAPRPKGRSRKRGARRHRRLPKPHGRARSGPPRPDRCPASRRARGHPAISDARGAFRFIREKTRPDKSAPRPPPRAKHRLRNRTSGPGSKGRRQRLKSVPTPAEDRLPCGRRSAGSRRPRRAEVSP